MSAYDYRPKPEIETLLAGLRQRILPIFTLEGAARETLKDRIAAAGALGQGGDPRLDTDTFIPLPGCPGVALGKYPVTVQEFAGFIEAGGYDDFELWSPEGWQALQQAKWAAPASWESQTGHPNRPVTGISWYEAEAWCRWASRQGGHTVRLPTAEEWRQAAMPDEQLYPWGYAEPDAERANFNRNVGGPTPVGVYPAGNGPLGHCDLAGNVWEWGEELAGQPVGPGAGRVLHGGSWISAQNVRAASRRRAHPANRYNSLGFRCSRVQS